MTNRQSLPKSIPIPKIGDDKEIESNIEKKDFADQMRTHRNITQHELIGLPIRVLGASDTKTIAIEGTLIDETKNTITIRKGNGKVTTIQKKGTEFEVEIDDHSWKKIHGNSICFRPEDRVKRLEKKRYNAHRKKKSMKS